MLAKHFINKKWQKNIFVSKLTRRSKEIQEAERSKKENINIITFWQRKQNVKTKESRSKLTCNQEDSRSQKIYKTKTKY